VGDIGNVLWVLMGTIGRGASDRRARMSLTCCWSEWTGAGKSLRSEPRVGAGWGQIARELLAESITLGVFGDFSAWLSPAAPCAIGGARAERSFRGSTKSHIDRSVLLFTLAISWYLACRLA